MSYKFSTFINSYNTECHIHYSGIIDKSMIYRCKFCISMKYIKLYKYLYNKYLFTIKNKLYLLYLYP